MFNLIWLVAVMAAINVVFAASINQPLPPTSPNSLDVDLFVNETAPSCTTVDNINDIQNGIIDSRYRWQNFNVQPDRAYDQSELNAINNAMYTLQQVLPCITFGIWPPTSSPTGDYVYITKGTTNGCSSYVGKLGGQQNMNLQSPGCMSQGTIMHEMIHALGFRHEHARFDRDDWVNIHWENIRDGQSHNFDIVDPIQYGTFGVPYNTRSIMHYQTTEFSGNGQPTITSKNGGAIGSEGDLKATDRQRLINMYGC